VCYAAPSGEYKNTFVHYVDSIALSDFSNYLQPLKRLTILLYI